MRKTQYHRPLFTHAKNATSYKISIPLAFYAVRLNAALLNLHFTCFELFRGEEFFDNGTELSAEVIAVEPPLKEDVPRRGAVGLHEIPEAVRLRL